MNPHFRVAPFSAVLVLPIGRAIGETPTGSALTRVLEVALGGEAGDERMRLGDQPLPTRCKLAHC